MLSRGVFCNRFIDRQFRGSYILAEQEVGLSVEIEMAIKGVVPDPVTNMPVVILREKSGDRVLPIWIGVFEGNAIELQREGVQTPRPMTHDLLKTVIDELGGHVERVVVSELKDNTFYATLHVLSTRGRLSVDSRPSDALALALRTGAPIFAEEAVIQNARSIQAGPETIDVGRLEKWLANLPEDDLGKYKM
jgi:hypothetical protein